MCQSLHKIRIMLDEYENKENIMVLSFNMLNLGKSQPTKVTTKKITAFLLRNLEKT